jgi:hypothetical protein
MRVWHFNGVITTYGKRDCRNSWRYANLAVNRGAIKRGFTVLRNIPIIIDIILHKAYYADLLF